MEQEPKEEQISERRIKLITCKEYWIEIIANEMWNRKNDWHIDRCEREAKKIVSDSFMKTIQELGDWQSKYSKLEEENKELKQKLSTSEIHGDYLFIWEQLQKSLKEIESLRGKVKELEDNIKDAWMESRELEEMDSSEFFKWRTFQDWKKSKGIEF